jgi:DNA polymerase-1
MIEGFIRGEDPHQITADVIVPKKMTSRLQMSDKDRRHIGKTFNFALVYGAGGFRLASLLGWDQHDHHKVVRAEELISQFWKKRPAVRRFMANMKMAALTEGVVKGVVGMHLHCPDATDSNPKARAHAMRRVGNFPVQNAGAILTLRAMTRIDEELLKRKFKSILIGQMHDSIYIDLHPKDNHLLISKLVTSVMVEEPKVIFPWLKVPLVAEPNIYQTMKGA